MTTYCIDSTEVAFTLIAEGAPERRKHLKEFWKKYAVCFERVDGKTGIVLNANKHRVQFACKDLQVMWLLGFALWKSIELFAPEVLLSTLKGVSSSSVFTDDKQLDYFEYHYRGRMEAVMTLIAAKKLDPEQLPPDISLPFKPRKNLAYPQETAAFDLVMMAISVLFLHELKHVEFHAEHDVGNPRPQKPAVEELQCDMWARKWFMSGVADYARKNNHSYQEVCSKRAMALSLASEYLRLADQHAGVVINKDYPPLAQRIDALSGTINLPDDDKFWFFSACILLAETRRQGKELPRLDGMSPKGITESLINVFPP